MMSSKKIGLKNLRTAPEFSVLAATIEKLAKGRPIHFCPSPGNYGDALINEGTRQFFQEYGIEVFEFTRSELNSNIERNLLQSDDLLLIVGGGGGWCENFSSTRPFVERVAAVYRSVIVLPTTYELAPPSSHNVTCFARDRGISLINNPEAIFCHDMAFYLDLRLDILKDPLWRLFAFRNDHEGLSLHRYFRNNIDVSMLAGGTQRKVIPFFSIIGSFQVVSTDRLHVAIAATLMNKRVFLVGGNYPKNKDLYDSSLALFHPRTEFLEFDALLEKLFPNRTAEESRSYLKPER